MKKRQGRRHQNRMASSIYLLCSYPFALVKKREERERDEGVKGSRELPSPWCHKEMPCHQPPVLFCLLGQYVLCNKCSASL